VYTRWKKSGRKKGNDTGLYYAISRSLPKYGLADVYAAFESFPRRLISSLLRCNTVITRSGRPLAYVYFSICARAIYILLWSRVSFSRMCTPSLRQKILVGQRRKNYRNDLLRERRHFFSLSSLNHNYKRTFPPCQISYIHTLTFVRLCVIINNNYKRRFVFSSTFHGSGDIDTN